MQRLIADWTVLDMTTGEVLNDPAITSTGLNHRNLVIKRNQLTQNKTYKFTLRLGYDGEPDKATFVTLKTASLSPSGGKCNIL